MRRSLDDPRYRELITKLVAIREAAELPDGKKFDQRELAKRLGRSRSFVSRVETFELRLDAVQLVDWLRGLDIDEKKFLGDTLGGIPIFKPKKR